MTLKSPEILISIFGLQSLLKKKMWGVGVGNYNPIQLSYNIDFKTFSENEADPLRRLHFPIHLSYNIYFKTSTENEGGFEGGSIFLYITI